MLKEVIELCERTGKAVVVEARKNLARGRKNATKRLSKSLGYKVTSTASKIEIRYYMTSYGPSVDMGRDGTSKKRRNKDSVFYNSGNRGSTPNITAIKKWIAVKGIKPKNDISTSQLAYLIGKKIKTDGVRASMFFTDAYNKHHKILDDKVGELTADLVSEATLNSIKDANNSR